MSEGIPVALGQLRDNFPGRHGQLVALRCSYQRPLQTAEVASMKRLRERIPDWLSTTRLVFTPLLFIPALSGDRVSFLLLGLVLVLTDVLDGILARSWQVTSYRGQVLDSVADTLFHAAFYGLALFLLWPEAQPYLFWMLLPLAWFILDIPFGWLLTGRPRAMHLWSKKTLSHVYLIWLVYSLLVGLNKPGIVLLNLWSFVAFLEEISMYVIARQRIDESATSVVGLLRTLHQASATRDPASRSVELQT